MSRNRCVARLAILMALLSAQALRADETVFGGERLARFKKRWKLELLPEKLPSQWTVLEQHLDRTTWGGLRDPDHSGFRLDK